MHGTQHGLGCMSQLVVGLCIHTATRDRFGGLLFSSFFRYFLDNIDTVWHGYQTLPLTMTTNVTCKAGDTDAWVQGVMGYGHWRISPTCEV